MLVLLLACFVGWMASHEQPLALFFATIVPITAGKLPPTIVGHGRLTGGTPEVPDDMQPQPRPTAETFLTLPGTGNQLPQNGLGMCCRWTAYDHVLVYRTVLWYLLLGGRHIDTASMYLNHVPIGAAIQEAVRRGISRDEIFVTTKLPPQHFGYNTTLAQVPTYLTQLGVDYIDLILMHAPAIFPYIQTNECERRGISKAACRQETWRALSELRTAGIVRNIGVSNFAVSHLQELQGLEGVAPIANNQIQHSPFVDASEQVTLEYCAAHNITITSYSPLGGLMDQDKAFAYGVLQDLAAKYERPVSQIMLRWAMQSHTAVIPGTGNPKHMQENLDIYNFRLSDEDFAVINDVKYAADAPIIVPMNQMLDMD